MKEADYTLQVLEQQSNSMRMTDAHAEEHEGQGSATMPLRLSREQLQRELEQREHLMRLRPAGAPGASAGGETDQWRVYVEAREMLKGERPARLLIQASAGTGKSFLLTTLYLWCILNRSSVGDNPFVQTN